MHAIEAIPGKAILGTAPSPVQQDAWPGNLDEGEARLRPLCSAFQGIRSALLAAEYTAKNNGEIVGDHHYGIAGPGLRARTWCAGVDDGVTRQLDDPVRLARRPRPLGAKA